MFSWMVRLPSRSMAMLSGWMTGSIEVQGLDQDGEALRRRSD